MKYMVTITAEAAETMGQIAKSHGVTHAELIVGLLRRELWFAQLRDQGRKFYVDSDEKNKIQEISFNWRFE